MPLLCIPELAFYRATMDKPVLLDTQLHRDNIFCTETSTLIWFIYLYFHPMQNQLKSDIFVINVLP